MSGPQFLTVEQFLLVTLVVKLAVMATLATMLVRYRRFRHILIFERRAWPDRFVFALSLGVPLVAGVWARLGRHVGVRPHVRGRMARAALCRRLRFRGRRHP